MSGRRFFLWLTQAAVTLFALSALFVGCSRQSEGERCDKKAAGNTDCNDGLECIECEKLARGSVDRCCPIDTTAHTEGACDRADTDRVGGECAPATGGTGGRGTGGRAGAGGSEMTGGSAGSGATSGAGGSGAVSGGGEGGATETGGSGGQ
jgi:hypothetical protein